MSGARDFVRWALKKEGFRLSYKSVLLYYNFPFKKLIKEIKEPLIKEYDTKRRT